MALEINKNKRKCTREKAREKKTSKNAWCSQMLSTDTVFLRLGCVLTSIIQTLKNAVEREKLQMQFSVTEDQGQTCSCIYTVSGCADDKTKNQTGTYILSCHSLEPKWSWRPRGYARYPANEWCLRSKEICSGQHTPLHSVFLHKRTREHSCKASGTQLIKFTAALCRGERGHRIQTRKFTLLPHLTLKTGW